MSLSKFQGCLMGALIGDCVGLPFEFLSYTTSTTVLNHFRKIAKHDFPEKSLVHSDDTAMTWALAQSLLDKRGFYAEDMAAKFTKAFYKEPSRGYGNNVKTIFVQWHHKDAKDIFQPAKSQFEGKGSYGNGSAMRIAPVALFAAHSYNLMLKMAEQSSLLTHYNQYGCNGALVQCIAICLALSKDPNDALNSEHFVDELIEKVAAMEARQSPFSESQIGNPPNIYTQQLKIVKTLLNQDEVTLNETVNKLGHDISAQRSVPTAIFAFLKGCRPIINIPIENPFERTVAYAISLGGDTDTIGSMAGSIAGAYYGIEAIPMHLQRGCENSEKALKLAKKLYKMKN